MLWAYLRLRHCVFYECECVWNRNVLYGMNSCRHPQHPELTVTWVSVHVHCGLFMCEQLRNSSSTNNAQRSRTIVPLTAFVCGGGETGNEITLRALAVCAQSLSKSRARPGGEYQSLISQPWGAYGNEETVDSVQCIKARWNLLWLQPDTAISPHLLPLPHTHLILTFLTKYYCETAHTKVMADHYYSKTHLSSYLRNLPCHYTPSYRIWRLHRGHRAERCYWLPKHLPSPSPPLFSFWKLSKLPPLTQDLACLLLHICHPTMGLLQHQSMLLSDYATSQATSQLPFITRSSLGGNLPSFD